MRAFLSKNWLLILLPILVVASIIAAILLTSDSDPGAGFQYGL